jgi:hypothetical protein
LHGTLYKHGTDSKPDSNKGQLLHHHLHHHLLLLHHHRNNLCGSKKIYSKLPGLAHLPIINLYIVPRMW